MNDDVSTDLTPRRSSFSDAPEGRNEESGWGVSTYRNNDENLSTLFRNRLSHLKPLADGMQPSSGGIVPVLEKL